MRKDDMPVGFAMALAMNPEAMQNFAALGEEQKQAIIAGTHTVNSKEEMRQYVASLVNGKNEQSY